MSDNHTELDRQIASLEDALKLPLPEATRAQIQHDLERLRAQRATSSGGSIQGTTDVSGTLYGNAIGVNLGTVQAYFGPQPPAGSGDQPPAQISQEEIDDQRDLLEAHRRTLRIYLKQQAQLGSAYAPPGVANGIREARGAIKRTKATLRSWSIAIADHPDDEAA